MVAFRYDINALRALAVLAVVFYHFELPYFSGGFIGVDIFFVISGFLMTKIIINGLNQDKFSIFQFYLSRCRRIIPPLLVLAVALIILGWFFLAPYDYKTLGKHISSSLSFLSNFIYYMESGYFDSASKEKWLLHTWSLSVEWQFYIIYPLIILTFTKVFKAESLSKLISVMFLTSLLLSWLLSESHPSSSFFLLHTRAWEMLFGGLIFYNQHCLPKKYRKSFFYISFLVLIAALFIINTNYIWPGIAALIPVIFTGLALLSNQNNKVINNRLIQFVGSSSYSIYLWHWPVVVALTYLNLLDDSIAIGIGLITTFILSSLSYLLIERNSQYIWKMQENKTFYLLLKPIFSTLIICFIAVALYALKGISNRVDSDVLTAANEAFNSVATEAECFDLPETNRPDCVFGNADNVQLIVIGDSHAKALSSAVYRSRIDKEQGVLELSYMSCPTIRGAKMRGLENHYCANYLKLQISKLKNEYKGIPLVVIGRWAAYLHNQNITALKTYDGPLIYFDEPVFAFSQTYFNDFKSRFTNTICEISQDRQVFLVQAVPEMLTNIPQQLSRNLMFSKNATADNLPLEVHNNRTKYTKEMLKHTHRICQVQVMDPAKYLCDKNNCKSTYLGRPIYYDGNHLSQFGNQLLEPMFKDEVWSKLIGKNSVIIKKYD